MSWKTFKLGDVLDVQNGYAFDSKKFNKAEGFPLIRIRDLKNGYITETNFTGEYDNRYVITKGDYLIGMDGEFRCYEWLGEDALLNQRVCRLQNFKSLIFDRYLYYTPKRRLTGLTPELTCKWEVGKPIVFDAVQLHATNKGLKDRQWNTKMGLLLTFLREM